MRKYLAKLASLRFTVVILVLSLALVLAGTLAQRHMGTFAAQEVYFASWFVQLPIPGTSTAIPMFPGGFLLGSLLIINMLASAVLLRRKVLRDPAFLLTHGGMIVLCGGVLLNTIWSVESFMEIDEGGSSSYSEDYNRVELAAMHAVDATHDQVTAIPQEYFHDASIAADALPFDIHVLGRYPKTVLALHAGGDSHGHESFLPQPAPQNLLETERRFLTLHLELVAHNKSLGRFWLTSGAIWDGAGWVEPQPAIFTHDGQTWLLTLRPQRYYRGQTIALEDFRHEQYAGTEIPSAFSSQIEITDSLSGESRAALISMNRPLRFAGQTFYQSGFRNNDRTTVLQVVQNPGWLLPYISCLLISVGMGWGFWRALRRHLAKRQSAVADSPSPNALAEPARWPSRAAMAMTVVVLFTSLGAFRLPKVQTEINTARFGQLPVLANGRIKPMDSVARNTLLQLSGKQTLRHDGKRISASAWLLGAMTDPVAADEQPVFRIDSPDVLGLMGRTPDDGRTYSFQDLMPHLNAIAMQANEARKAADAGAEATAFGAAVMNLDSRILLYNRMKNTLRPAIELDYSAGIMRDHDSAADAWNPSIRSTAIFINDAAAFRPVPPVDGAPADLWRTAGAAVTDAATPADLHPAALGYAALVDAVKSGDSARANQAIEQIHAATDGLPKTNKVASEYRFNVTQPFYLAMCLYVLVAILMCAAWLRWWEFGRKAAFGVLLVAILLHSIGMFWRSWLHGYAPVTNLYSSAIFVGWMAALLSALLEWRQRQGVASVAGAVVGFTTLIIAHHLARSGETMEMMRAVLASNFWLSTHVVTIAMGYGGMFLAGAVGAWAILRDAVRRRLPTASKRLAPTVYGIICFSILLSFVGTVLGGIWADQSWGRFWGWDPKENGALMIVAWCAVILHARVGHFLSDRALHMSAVFGSAITAFSWFGVNLLGVGLHSYGFTSSGLFWLLAFIGSQLLIIVIGMVVPDPDMDGIAAPSEPAAVPTAGALAPN